MARSHTKGDEDAEFRLLVYMLYLHWYKAVVG
jgi:hypothetical protein